MLTDDLLVVRGLDRYRSLSPGVGRLIAVVVGFAYEFAGRVEGESRLIRGLKQPVGAALGETDRCSPNRPATSCRC